MPKQYFQVVYEFGAKRRIGVLTSRSEWLVFKAGQVLARVPGMKAVHLAQGRSVRPQQQPIRLYLATRKVVRAAAPLRRAWALFRRR